MKLIIAILLLAIGAFAQNTTYKDGTDCDCDSLSKAYYESGNLWGEIPVINGIETGIMKIYYESGNLEQEMPYNINKGTNGVIRYYYESGELQIIEHVLHGLSEGVTMWYFQSGKLAGTATYKKGKLVGYKKCTDGRFGNDNLDCLN